MGLNSSHLFSLEHHMTGNDFATRIRQFERYSSARLMPDCWTIVRVDGRGFSSLTAARFEKPFDTTFHALMCQTAKALVHDMQGVLAYTQSDEISLVLPPSWTLFDRRAEKLNSLCAGIASGTFSLGLGSVACFDSRLWVGPSMTHVIDYMRWRQADASRCALNNVCYWTLRHDELSAQQATRALKGMSTPDKHELLHTHHINFNTLPTWQKRGVLVAWEHYTKSGENPITGEATQAQRRRLVVDPEIHMKDAFGSQIRHLLADHDE